MSTRALLVVLGDLGRSPRMQYHALALADSGVDVDIIGYAGNTPLRTLAEHPRIRQHLVAPLATDDRAGWPRMAFLALASARTVIQGLRLFLMILMLKKPDVMLVQNPPAMPTLLVCLVVARMRSVRLVIDWHNFSHSMLALRLGAANAAVRVLRSFEMTLGRRADAHLCVSGAMKAQLGERWAIGGAVVFRDRPSERFSATPPEVRAEIVQRCLGDKSPPAREPRPAIVVCSTSWTADEDLSILIAAGERYDAIARTNQDKGADYLPKLLILITGRGPLRAQYEVQIARTRLDRVTIQTLWLTPEDYALLVGSADLGVSCHRSASGVDLAMKVADFFGAGVPVCALDYGACLAEQVRNGENGLTFKSPQELAAQFCDLLRGFPIETPLLKSLRANLVRSRIQRWSDGWKAEAAPILLR